MKKIKLAFLLMLFSLCLPGRAWSGCGDLLIDDPLADNLTNNVAQHQYRQYQMNLCGGGGGGGGVSVPSCTSGQYLSGSSCLYCSSAMPGCSACSSASCNSCSSDSDCTVSSGYACVSGKCTKKCSSSSLPYWCSVQSSCTASAAACRNLNLNLAGDCYQPTEAERCNCSGNKTINQTLQTKLMCAVERMEACDCGLY